MQIVHPPKIIDRILLAGITPYFLEKGGVWFEENLSKLITARKTQPFFQENTLLLEVGTQEGLSPILRKLDELGYEKVFRAGQPGEFSHIGGIIEVFPIHGGSALRLEFRGNIIETIEKLPVSVPDEDKARDILKKRLRSQKMFSDLKGIKEGEYLVHLDHGVALFRGFEEVQGKECYALEYAAGDKLFVPKGLERKLSRFVGFGEPRISRLSSPLWFKTKHKIRKEVEELARKLLDLYAKRNLATRPPYEKTSELEEHLASTFAYVETPDQRQALEDIQKDMAQEEPMDRLVCGDVGFGKTEIALRSMARAVENGRQTALLTPTTILAHQHYLTFQERLKDTPARTALLSRLQSAKEQVEILKELREGKIDIVIGTHRLLSKDVQFHNLGLLVIDDEQRFGVKQKERLLEARESLDVLSLSATPIPRTLYMALSSLKEVSMVQTPPEERRPPKTIVARRNAKRIKSAIQEELSRKGQVYYLHNRVGTIRKVRRELELLVPEATIGVAHAKLSEHELIEVMEDFRHGRYDVLCSTTIIENGLDLPNVNTLIVEDATKLGLSQAYQLRGRVGRGKEQAYAYFLYGSGKLTEKARMRLQALKEATELGAGYRIALQDMEIRGAGNILGKEQSGSVNAVGLNLYCQMLSEAVEHLRP
ncbi:DEAD/DEAH box helicase [Patescibacteria group bacterium]|nr:DEAD/DEAH box helicase [Patescibacteria group bacterium]